MIFKVPFENVDVDEVVWWEYSGQGKVVLEMILKGWNEVNGISSYSSQTWPWMWMCCQELLQPSHCQLKHVNIPEGDGGKEQDASGSEFLDQLS